MYLGPPLFLQRLLLQAVAAWLLVRAIYVALALRAQWPDPVAIAPRSVVILIGVVVGVTWLDLRRRNLLVLLPNLGVPIAAPLAGAAGIVAIAEFLLSQVVP